MSLAGSRFSPTGCGLTPLVRTWAAPGVAISPTLHSTVHDAVNANTAVNSRLRAAGLTEEFRREISVWLTAEQESVVVPGQPERIVIDPGQGNRTER